MLDGLDMSCVRLLDCTAGDEAEIIEITASTSLAARLGEMGMIPGAWVRVLRQGSPLIVQVGEARLCLRGSEASKIRVRNSFLEKLGAGVFSSFPAGAEDVAL
mgnify:CR=1 FL=1